MAVVIKKSSILKAAGNKPKILEEFIGRVNSNTEEVSIAKMKSPYGWEEPGQKPEFNEYSYVLNGVLRVRTKDDYFDISAGETFIAEKGEWIQYSTPFPSGAEYIAVCVPAFSPDLVNRDEE